MSIENLTVANCCEGKLAELFDDAVSQVQADIASRPGDTQKRVITIKVEMTPLEGEQLDIAVTKQVTIPAIRRTSRGRFHPTTGKLQQCIPLEEPELPLEAQEAEKVTKLEPKEASATGGK